MLFKSYLKVLNIIIDSEDKPNFGTFTSMKHY